MKNLIALGTLVALAAGLGAAWCAAPETQPAEPAAKGPSVEVVALRIARQGENKSPSSSYVPGALAGVEIHFRVTGAKLRLLGVDTKSLKVRTFTDDRKTDLGKAVGWSRPTVGPFPRVGADGKSLVFSIRSPFVPAPGARELHLQATVMLHSGADRRTAWQRGIALKKGETFGIGGAKFEVVEVGDGRFALETRDDIARIETMEFFAGGAPAGFQAAVSSRINDKRQLFFRAPKLPATVDLRCTYFERFQAVPVTIDRKIGVGLERRICTMSETARRPNVIWMFGDQHRGQAMGYRGDPNLSTPNLDRLATEGLDFHQAVAGCPWCTPYRASLLTSRYPHETCRRTPQLLDPSIPTIARPFNEAGYETAYVGKWHLHGWPENQGRSAKHIIPRDDRGEFGQWIGYENNNSQYNCWVHGHDREGCNVEMYQLPGYETDALTDLAIDLLRTRTEQNDERPFFLVLSVQPPHDPYVAPPADAARHRPADVQLRPNVPEEYGIADTARRDLAGYYGMIENLDANLGRLRVALADLGLTDETHLMFFSDHGDMHGSHGHFRKHVPYEESLRIPLILGGCESIYSHRYGSCDAVVNHVDVAPTTLGLCGIDAPDWMVGYDYAANRLRDREANRADEPDSAFCQLIPDRRGWGGVDRAWRAVVTRDGWKYACFREMPWLLFNLNEDPYEQVNLALRSPWFDQRRALHERLARWIQETGDDFPLPSIE